MNKQEKRNALCYILGRVEAEFYLEHYDIALDYLGVAEKIIKKELIEYNKNNG